MAEDVELAKSFVATSEDSIVGSNQKSADFKAKMLQNYNKLIEKYNRMHHQSYPRRKNPNSLFNSLDAHSRPVLKMLGIKETMGETPSGDTDAEKFNQMIRGTWVKQNPDNACLCDAIWNLHVVLSKHPKWRKFQSDEGREIETRKKKREANAPKSRGERSISPFSLAKRRQVTTKTNRCAVIVVVNMFSLKTMLSVASLLWCHCGSNCMHVWSHLTFPSAVDLHTKISNSNWVPLRQT